MVWAREYLDATQTMRIEMVNHAACLRRRRSPAGRQARFARVRERRRALVSDWPTGQRRGELHNDRQSKARHAYDAVDKQAAEVDAVITSMGGRDGRSGEVPPRSAQGEITAAPEMEAELGKCARRSPSAGELDKLRGAAASGVDEACFADDMAREKRRSGSSSPPRCSPSTAYAS